VSKYERGIIMNEIKTLNKQFDLENNEVESMISELVEREEYTACTANGCGAQACGANV